MQSGGDVFIKVIVVGEQGVGKTCLLNQYCYNKFDSTTPPTIGVDFTMKVKNMNGQEIKLQLWDIAGQERYKSVSKMYVRGAQGCLIVSDILDQTSLQETLKWKELVEENSDIVDNKPIPMMIIQNKVDEVKQLGKLEDFQTEQYISQFAQDNGFQAWMQTSAKENINLKEAFEKIVDIILTSGRVKATQKIGNFAPKPKTQEGSNQESNSNSQSNQPIKLQQSAPQQKKDQKNGGCC